MTKLVNVATPLVTTVRWRIQLMLCTNHALCVAYHGKR